LNPSSYKHLMPHDVSCVSAHFLRLASHACCLGLRPS
jgi:hypothetical protein